MLFRSFSGIISGSGGLLKEGNGTFALLGINTYTGATEVYSGTLVVGNSNALGSGRLVLDDGALIQANNPSLTLGNAFTVNGSVEIGR